MDAKRTVSARINEGVYLKAKEDAAENDMSLSEWIEDRINDGSDDSLTGTEILNMDWDEKETVVDDYGLDIDSDAYNDDDDAFAEAIIDDLGLEYPSDYHNPGNFTWLFLIPVVGFFVWLLLRKPDVEQ